MNDEHIGGGGLGSARPATSEEECKAHEALCKAMRVKDVEELKGQVRQQAEAEQGHKKARGKRHRIKSQKLR